MSTHDLENVQPWNRERAVALTTADPQRRPHAWLFCGPAGLGKNSLVTWLAQRLLCRQPIEGNGSCGQCQSCILFAAGSHPDFHVVQPEVIFKSSESLITRYAQRYAPPDKSKESKDSTVIRIDQIRSLIENAQTRPQIAACKIIMLSPADSMNTNAANSLLKLLEEPPADTYLLLVADRPNRLPATIRSRCTRVDFSAPSPLVAERWLQTQGLPPERAQLLLGLAGGAPLAALALAQSDFLEHRASLLEDMDALAGGRGDPLACAARWKTLGAERCLSWLQGWLNDLIATCMHAGNLHLQNPDNQTRLQALEKRLDLKQLFHFADRVAQNRTLLGGPLDELLLLEDTLIRWMELR